MLEVSEKKICEQFFHNLPTILIFAVLLIGMFFFGKFVGEIQKEVTLCEVWFENNTYAIPYKLTNFSFCQFQINETYRIQYSSPK
jgi:hypothetical protein